MEKSGFKDEDGLLESCRIGDEQAWAYFVKRFSPLVYWAIRDKVSRSLSLIDESDIDDIFQQTFTHIWCKNRLKDLKNPKAISSYIAIIAQNSAADFLRKKNRLINLLLPAKSEELCACSDPHHERHGKEIQEEVDRIINTLPIKERRVITLELFYDLKHREISKIMSIPINTVSTIISRVKKILRERLKERGCDV